MAFQNIEFAADIKACEIKLFLEKFDFAYSTKGTPNCKEIHFGKTLRLKDFSGKPVPKKRAVNFKGKQYRFNTSTENCFKNDFEDNAHFRALWLACFKSLQRVTGAKNHEFANLQCNVTEDATLSPHRDDCSKKLRTFLPAALTIVIASKDQARFTCFKEDSTQLDEGTNNDPCYSDPCNCSTLVGTLITEEHYRHYKHGPNNPSDNCNNPGIRYSLNFRIVRQELVDLLQLNLPTV